MLRAAHLAGARASLLWRHRRLGESAAPEQAASVLRTFLCGVALARIARGCSGLCGFNARRIHSAAGGFSALITCS